MVQLGLLGPCSAVVVCSLWSYAAWASTIFYLEQAGGSRKGEQKCLGYFHDIGKGTRTLVLSDSKCPGHVLLDKTNLYYTRDDGLYSRSVLKEQEKPRFLAKLPAEDVNLWLDEKTGRVRSAYFLEVDGKLVRKSKGKDDGAVLTFRGKRHKVVGGWGTPGMALSVELQDGQWSLLEQRATAHEACATAGLMILDSANVGKFQTGINDLWNRHVVVDEAEPEIGKMMPSHADPSQVSKISLSGSKQLYFGHFDVCGMIGKAKTPIYFCDKPCRQPRKVDWSVAGGISLAVKANHLLVSEMGLRPRVYDVTTEKLLLSFPKASMSMRVP